MRAEVTSNIVMLPLIKHIWAGKMTMTAQDHDPNWHVPTMNVDSKRKMQIQPTWDDHAYSPAICHRHVSWLYLKMAVFTRHSLLQGINWSLLGLDLWGENPGSGLQWLDLTMSTWGVVPFAEAPPLKNLSSVPMVPEVAVGVLACWCLLPSLWHDFLESCFSFLFLYF
jgi:hypothetical protein